MKVNKETLDRLLSRKERITSRDVATATGVTRQYASVLLRNLVREGKLERVGFTRAAFYVKPGSRQETSGQELTRRFRNSGLDEDKIFDSLRRHGSFISDLPDSVERIFGHAFVEMLNNAIEHSKSDFVEIRAGKEGSIVWFIVDDFGIGVFRNIMKKMKLASELEAIQDLLKGKATTHLQTHSGEGIFFTSKIADAFILESFGLRLRIDNVIDDIFIEETQRKRKGTRVIFRVSEKPRKELEDVFKKYQTDAVEGTFDKTEVKVRLYAMGTEYISRSQARRLLVGLDKFKSIILDFDRVHTIGQGFADQIFRVFRKRHPEIKVTSINANRPVQFMIDRVAKD